jgi:hypothetical protein
LSPNRRQIGVSTLWPGDSPALCGGLPLPRCFPERPPRDHARTTRG